MGKILCATRGGEESYCTQDEAISLAKEQGDDLVYLYVVDTHFLDHTAAPIMVDIEDELCDLGKFLLLMAKERAEKEGVEADFTVRKGDFKAALVEAAQDVGAELIVLGRPADDNVTTMEYLESTLSPALKEETGCDVQVV